MKWRLVSVGMATAVLTWACGAGDVPGDGLQYQDPYQQQRLPSSKAAVGEGGDAYQTPTVSGNTTQQPSPAIQVTTSGPTSPAVSTAVDTPAAQGPSGAFEELRREVVADVAEGFDLSQAQAEQLVNQCFSECGISAQDDPDGSASDCKAACFGSCAFLRAEGLECSSPACSCEAESASCTTAHEDAIFDCYELN